MKAIFFASVLAISAFATYAQTAQTLPSALLNAEDLPSSGEIDGVSVGDVVVMTKSEIGPFTRFLIVLPDSGTYWKMRGPKSQAWFYVRNDDNTKALERGAIIGLLMGAAETGSWSSEEATVNITYSTVNGRHEIETASLESKILH